MCQILARVRRIFGGDRDVICSRVDGTRALSINLGGCWRVFLREGQVLLYLEGVTLDAAVVLVIGQGQSYSLMGISKGILDIG